MKWITIKTNQNSNLKKWIKVYGIKSEFQQKKKEKSRLSTELDMLETFQPLTCPSTSKKALPPTAEDVVGFGWASVTSAGRRSIDACAYRPPVDAPIAGVALLLPPLSLSLSWTFFTLFSSNSILKYIRINVKLNWINIKLNWIKLTLNWIELRWNWSEIELI